MSLFSSSLIPTREKNNNTTRTNKNYKIKQQTKTVCGPPQFYVFGDSRELCKSGIVVPVIRMQADGKNC
jgi:hypothetical protein